MQEGFLVVIFLIIPLIYGSSVTVKPPCGPVLGSTVGGTNSWLGIPYGTAKRFSDPIAFPAWRQKPFVATKFGPMCPQLPLRTERGEMSEDCLSINVWAPSNSSALPVLVWIYGGGFNTGHSSQQGLGGQVLSENGHLVVVSFNYRVNAFGWLSGHGLGGNYGFKDQILALSWVQANIAAFGGDPERVTLFGQSAGAISVNLFLTSKSTWGLFHRAIVESAVPALHLRTPEESDEYLDLLLLKLRCLDLDCIRRMPWRQLVNATGSQAGIPFPHLLRNLLHWSPVIDNVTIWERPLDAFVAGRYRPNTKVLLGSTGNESVGFLWSFSGRMSAAEYEMALLSYFGASNASRVLALYPATPDPWASASRIATHVAFSCPAQEIAESVPSAKMYNFLHMPFEDPFNPKFCWNRYSCHAAELSYVFRIPGNYTVLPPEQRLAGKMQAMWTAFAHGDNLQDSWPLYQQSGGQSLSMVAPDPIITTNYLREECSLLRSIGAWN